VRLASSRADAPPAAGVSVRDGTGGWAVSAWLVSHAAAYGISAISYQGYQWRAGHAAGGWTRIADGPSQPPPATVVFG
jgi:hypothetical protein